MQGINWESEYKKKLDAITGIQVTLDMPLAVLRVMENSPTSTLGI